MASKGIGDGLLRAGNCQGSMLIGMVLLASLLFSISLPVALAGADTSSRSQAQACTAKELVKPTVSKAVLYSPGKATQSDVVTVDIAATPEECHGVVRRRVQYEVIKTELRRINGKLQHKKYWNESFNDSYYTKDEAGSIGIVGAADTHNDWSLYHCSVGKAITTMRVTTRVIVTNLTTHKEIARKLFNGPLLEIRGINKGKGC